MNFDILFYELQLFCLLCHSFTHLTIGCCGDLTRRGVASVAYFPPLCPLILRKISKVSAIFDFHEAKKMKHEFLDDKKSGTMRIKCVLQTAVLELKFVALDDKMQK